MTAPTVGPAFVPVASQLADEHTRRTLAPTLRLALTFFGCVAAVLVASYRAEDATTLASFLLCIFLLVVLNGTVRRVGSMSVGGIALLLTGGLFAGKWLVSGITPAVTASGEALSPNPKALLVTALALLGFTLAYASGVRLLPERPRPRPVAPFQRREWILLFGIAVLATAGRLWVARSFNIGVPSVRPHPVPFAGILYYTFTVGPLVGAAAMVVSNGGRKAPQRGALIVLSLWTSVGVFIGWRGDPIKAALVLLAARAVARPATRVSRLNVPARAVRGAITVTFLILAITLAINFRAGSGVADLSPSRSFTFLAQRAGGIDFLSPVITSVDRHGRSAEFLDSARWDHFLKTRVYRLPAKAQSAFASTAFGWWYALGGLRTTVILGAVFGFLAALYDGMFNPRRLTDQSFLSKLVFVAVLFSWANFLLEGAPATSLKTAIAACGLSFVLDHVTRVDVSSLGLVPLISGRTPAAGDGRTT